MSLWGEFTKSACLCKFCCIIATFDVNKNPPKQRCWMVTSRAQETKHMYQLFAAFLEKCLKMCHAWIELTGEKLFCQTGKSIYSLFLSFFTDIIRSGPEINQDPASNICQRVSINWIKMDKAGYLWAVWAFEEWPTFTPTFTLCVISLWEQATGHLYFPCVSRSTQNEEH